jgi:hypothetical protein
MPFKYQPRDPLLLAFRRYQSETPLPLAVELALWLYPIKFQLFIAICPGGDGVRLPRLKQVLRRFVAAAEKYHRAPLGYTVGYETQPSANCHMCVACAAQLDRRWIEDCLKELLGPSLYTEKSIYIREFDFQQEGVAYTLKAANITNRSRDDDWGVKNIDLFLPSNMLEQLPDKLPLSSWLEFHRKKRRARRQAERVESSRAVADNRTQSASARREESSTTQSLNESQNELRLQRTRRKRSQAPRNKLVLPTGARSTGRKYTANQLVRIEAESRLIRKAESGEELTALDFMNSGLEPEELAGLMLRDTWRQYFRATGKKWSPFLDITQTRLLPKYQELLELGKQVSDLLNKSAVEWESDENGTRLAVN